MNGKKIDISLLTTMLNAAIFVILTGGLIFGYDTATLIAIGVTGYGTCFILNRIVKKQRAQQAEAQEPRRKR